MNRFKPKLLSLPLILILLTITLFIGGSIVVANIFLGSSAAGAINLQKGLVGHWDFNGNAEDRTPNSNDGTVTGATLAADRKAQSNRAYSFDGVANVISFGDITLVDGLSAVSFGGWINPVNYGEGTAASNVASILAKGTFSGVNTNSILAYFQGDGAGGNNFSVNVDVGTALGGVSVSAQSNIPTSAWTHFMATWASGETVKLYLNGAYVTQGGITTGTIVNIAQALKFGSSDYGSEDFYQGSIDDVRIYNRALSAAEVTALYNSYDPGVAVSTLQKGLVGHWKFDSNAQDSTPNSNDGTLNGSVGTPTLTTDRRNRSNSAYTFNSTLTNYQRVELSRGSVFSFGNGTSDSPFSVSAWINIDTNEAYPGGIIMGRWDVQDATAQEWYLTVHDPNGAMRFIMYDESTDATVLATTTKPSNGVWHHVVATYDGSGGTTAWQGVDFYVDGTAQSVGGTHIVGAGGNYVAMENGSALAMIGNCEGCGSSFMGVIDDARLYNRVLTAAEVTALYNSYDPGIAVSTLQKGLVGYWDLNGNAEDRTPNSNDGTVTAATLTTDRKSQSDKAYHFDGSDDYITLSSSILPTAAITVATWVQLDSHKSWSHFVKNRFSSEGDWLLFENATSWEWSIRSPGTTQQTVLSAHASTTAWTFLVGTYDGTTQRLYVNGAEVGTPLTHTVTLSQAGLSIGDTTTTSPDGKIDDVRIYNRALTAAEVLALYNSYR